MAPKLGHWKTGLGAQSLSPVRLPVTWQQGTNLAPLGWIPVIPKHAVEL